MREELSCLEELIQMTKAMDSMKTLIGFLTQNQFVRSMRNQLENFEKNAEFFDIEILS